MFEPTAQQIKDLTTSNHFDPDWYRATYPDVDATGLDPALHYLRYGWLMGRDPGPVFSTSFIRTIYKMREEHEPIARLAWLKRQGHEKARPDSKVILKAASLIAQTGDCTRAIALAEAYLPSNLIHTAHILRANKAIAQGDEDVWLRHLNAYLASFDLASIRLEGNGTIFERLCTAPLSPVTGGPRVSVIMPAWNAEKTVEKAAQSILDQTWKNLELLIVDDCSTDATWSVMQRIAATDDRVRILRNKVNVGPYVSKNLAVQIATGDYVTGHDADDWAHPERLAKHVGAAKAQDLDASLTYMIRMQPTGVFARIGKAFGFSMDAVNRKASISCLFEREILNNNLGYWDTVRFGADSEMIARAEIYLGSKFAVLPQISMICLDLEESLTNHPEHGVYAINGISPIRANYRDNWTAWHKENAKSQSVFLSFPQTSRRYGAAREMVIDHESILLNAEGNRGDA